MKRTAILGLGAIAAALAVAGYYIPAVAIAIYVAFLLIID